MLTRIVVVGACPAGRRLSERMAAKNQVFLLDFDTEALQSCQMIDPAEGLPNQEDVPGLWGIKGDGTSRLTLTKLFDPDRTCSLVTLTGEDDINYEAARLAKSIGYSTIIAQYSDEKNRERFQELNITQLNRTAIISNHIENSLGHFGAVVPTTIGLGKGELVEVRLVRTSPLLNRPLQHIAPYRWRVSAIFRDDKLIVPTGETRLQADDRVLLVGDPKLLPSISEYLRMGTAQFPLQFGPNIVTLEFNGADEALAYESEILKENSRSSRMIRGISGIQNEMIMPKTLLQTNEEVTELPTRFALKDMDDEEFLFKLDEQQAGLVVVRPKQRNFISKLLFVRGMNARLCDLMDTPILFARGTSPYKRILLPVSGSSLDIHAAELAIDITRVLSANLTSVNVDLPTFISGLSDAAIHEEVLPIKSLCKLYEVPLDYRHYEGNPIKHIMQEAANHDLIVMARRKGRKDSASNPDVTLHIARTAPCSVMVLPVDQ